MGVSLDKGGRVSLSKGSPGLTRIRVGLGWDERATDGAEYDLDASMFLLDGDGKCSPDANFVFYGNLAPAHLKGAVEHTGDNLTGGGDGDDEVIKINLYKVQEGKIVDVELEAGDRVFIPESWL